MSREVSKNMRCFGRDHYVYDMIELFVALKINFLHYGFRCLHGTESYLRPCLSGHQLYVNSNDKMQRGGRIDHAVCMVLYDSRLQWVDRRGTSTEFFSIKKMGHHGDGVALYRTVQDCWTLDLAGHGRNPSL